MGTRPWWDKSRFADRVAFLEARRRIVRAVRAWFDAQDFLEVETPALQVSPGLEPHLRALATSLHEPFGEGSRTLYLHTSPEFAMKKLLAAGLSRIYQLAHVFRDGERAALHHPEFSMLEWYRAGVGAAALMDDCEGLLRAAAAGAESLRRGDAACDLLAPFERLSVAEAFARHAGFDVLETISDPADPDPDPGPIKAAATKAGVAVAEADRFEDVFFRVLLARIEPRLGHGRPTLLHDYPLCLAALARAKPSDPRVAERFELYVCGVELANGCAELTDAALLRRRFAHFAAVKERLYGARCPVDEDFLAAVEAGPREAAGIAMGFDRLVMLVAGAPTVEDVLWAPVAGPD